MADKQLEQLNREIAALNAKVDAAKKDWRRARDPQEKADLKRVYERTYEDAKDEKARLDSRRAQLEAKLPSIGSPRGEQVDELLGRIKIQESRLEDQESRIKMVQFEVNRHRVTSQSDQAVREETQRGMQSVTNFISLKAISENDPRVEEACTAVMEAFPNARAPTGTPYVKPKSRTSKRARSDHEAEEDKEQAVAQAGDEPSSSTSHIQGSRYPLPGHSLVDLINRGMDLKETADMQPAVMKLLQAVAAKLGRNYYLEDTSLSSSRMVSPNSQPDVTALAVPGSRSWGNAVFTGEFKLGDTPPEIAQAIGQEMKRTVYTFEGQVDERTDAVALILTLNSLELLWIRKREDGSFDVYTTGQQSFSVSAASPGFRWLVRLLLTPPHELGFRVAAVPDLQQLESVAVRELQLIRKGSTHGSGSFVWACESSMGDAVLKLNKMPQEGDLLERLRGAPHVMQLIARGTCSYLNCNWHAVLFQPVVKLLTQSDSLLLVSQVVFDVAGGISECADRGIAQRDTTERNMGYNEEGRGFLMDFSAGKFVKGHDWSTSQASDSPKSRDVRQITGTLMAAPLSVLQGQPHTVSSMLEGLFLSVYNIACDGKLPHHLKGNAKLLEWEVYRRGTLTRMQLPKEPSIIRSLRPLIDELHDLFYPRIEGSSARLYSENVTVASFQAACQRACKGELKSS